MSRSSVADALRQQAQAFADRAYAPFSQAPVAAVFLCRDGTMIPGVRVESASFSLSLPALLNAYTTAVAAGRRKDVIGVAMSREITDADAHYVSSLPDLSISPAANDVWLTDAPCPSPMDILDPRLPERVPGSPADNASSVGGVNLGIQLAREAARRAYVPSSDFQVGAVIETPEGSLFPGVNVEHPDWSRILCAERNAAGTARTYGEPAANRIFLTCLDDPEGTPCGACRQVLAELTPDAALWMDRHSAPPEKSAPQTLLPGFFQGRQLLASDEPAPSSS